jgi:lipopolysaccharide biosynthesis glycosyltransferase
MPANPARPNEIALVTATDNGYAMPLAVTIRTLLDTLGPDQRVRLYVMDGGIADESKSKLLKSWNDPRIVVEWRRPDVSRVSDLLLANHVNIVTYFRLITAEVLPANLDRVIYIDPDMLIRRDIADLWNEPQGNDAVLAVPCIGAPYIDARVMMPNFDKALPYLAGITPVPNYEELGLSNRGHYFNAGLQVMDLAHWRRADLGEQMIRCMREQREKVHWCDQYALNIIMAGRWRALDYRWNQEAHVYEYPNWQSSPIDAAAFERLQHEPWIVHFTSPTKPWQYFCSHPWSNVFRATLKRTEWRNFSPQRPADFWQKWWDFHSQPLRQRWQPLRQGWKSRVRAVKQIVRGRRAA